MLKEIVELAEKMGTVENIKLELKRVQSVKCRLAKQKAKVGYEAEMEKVVVLEQALKEARRYLEPAKLTVTTMSEKDIAVLNYDETIKAIKSIQSKKCNTQWLVADQNENVEYQDALRIERMLLEHKKTQKPIAETTIKKSTVNELINDLENVENMSKEELLERLKRMI